LLIFELSPTVIILAAYLRLMVCFHVFAKEETSSGTTGAESKNNNVEARMHETRIAMLSAAYCSEATH